MRVRDDNLVKALLFVISKYLTRLGHIFLLEEKYERKYELQTKYFPCFMLHHTGITGFCTN